MRLNRKYCEKPFATEPTSVNTSGDDKSSLSLPQTSEADTQSMSSSTSTSSLPPMQTSMTAVPADSHPLQRSTPSPQPPPTGGAPYRALPSLRQRVTYLGCAAINAPRSEAEIQRNMAILND
ncbi:unnamed protein product, partial [Oppiella nova]